MISFPFSKEFPFFITKGHGKEDQREVDVLVGGLNSLLAC